MKEVNGRDWTWWISLNSHECYFCYNEYLKTASFGKGSQRFEDMHLGKQTNSNMCQRGYWNKLYWVWLRHMKQYHPELLEIK